MGPISVVSPISKKISTFLAALFKQLLDFRIYLFLKIFAKSINKLTRGDYVSEVQLPKLDPNTEIRRNDGSSLLEKSTKTLDRS